MATASIHFQDAENGEILTRVDLIKGYDPDSYAHKIVGQVLAFLDAQAQKKTFIQNTDESDDSIIAKAKAAGLLIEPVGHGH